MKNFVSILLLVFIISCQKKETTINTYVKEIDISDAFSKDNKIYLSNLTNKINYIQLQTDSNCFINRINRPWEDVKFSVKRIFINDNKESLLCFDYEGNFITQIGKKGKGPGEFLRIDNFTIIEKQKLVLLFDAASQKLLFYDYDNNFIKNVKVDAWPLHISNLNDENIVFESAKGRRELNNYRSLFIINQEGKVLNRLIDRSNEKDVHDQIGLYSIAFFYDYFDTLSYWEYYYDIVYRILDDKTIIPKYYFNVGKNKIPFEILLKLKSNPTYKTDYYARVWRFVETEDYFFLRTANDKKLHHILYDKKTEDVFNVHYMDGPQHNFAFINDIDGGISFWPEGLVNRNRVFSIEYGYEIREKLLSESKNKLEPKDKKLKNILLQMVNKSQVSDNPILMMVELNK